MIKPTIVSVRITDQPNMFFDPLPKVIAQFKDSSEKVLFSFYQDEITFTEAEFVGMTEDEACQLRHRKDVAYFQS